MNLNSCQGEFVLEVRLLSNSVIKALRWKAGGSEQSPANFAETSPFGGSFLFLFSYARAPQGDDALSHCEENELSRYLSGGWRFVPILPLWAPNWKDISSCPNHLTSFLQFLNIISEYKRKKSKKKKKRTILFRYFLSSLPQCISAKLRPAFT